MSDPSNPLDWAEYAERDWEAAKVLIRRKRPLTTNSCYHAQQSAEKYLKALLVSRGVDFPKTHDLSTLNTLCNDAGILTGLSPKALALLTDYAITARYPGEAPTPEDTKESLEIAKTVRKFARKWLEMGK